MRDQEEIAVELRKPHEFQAELCSLGTAGRQAAVRESVNSGGMSRLMAKTEPQARQGDRAWFRANSGLQDYDSALRLEPSPRFVGNTVLPSGLGVLTQIEPSETGRAQEAIVNLSRQVVVLFADSSRHYEWHVEGRKLVCGLPTGAVATMSAHQRSRWVSPAGRRRVVHLHLPMEWMRATLPDRSDHHLANRFFAPDPPLRQLVKAFLMDLSCEGADNPMLMESYAALIVRKVLSGSEPAPLRGGLAPWQIRRVEEFLRARMAEPISLAAIADIARLSPFHFARAFKTSVGVAPHAHLQSLRLERARNLLAETDMPITEVAAEVGYDSPQSLARVLRRESGVTPTRYRRERRA